MTRGLVLTLALLFTALHPAFGQETAIAQFNDGNLLTRAVGDVGAMGVEELRALSGALVECTTLDEKLKVSRECRVRSIRYDLEYGDGRAVDKLWGAVEEILRAMDGGVMTDQINILSRLLKIDSELKIAISKGFQARRRLPQP